MRIEAVDDDDDDDAVVVVVDAEVADVPSCGVAAAGAELTAAPAVACDGIFILLDPSCSSGEDPREDGGCERLQESQQRRDLDCVEAYRRAGPRLWGSRSNEHGRLARMQCVHRVPAMESQRTCWLLARVRSIGRAYLFRTAVVAGAG